MPISWRIKIKSITTNLNLLMWHLKLSFGPVSSFQHECLLICKTILQYPGQFVLLTISVSLPPSIFLTSLRWYLLLIKVSPNILSYIIFLSFCCIHSFKNCSVSSSLFWGAIWSSPSCLSRTSSGGALSQPTGANYLLLLPSRVLTQKRA